MEVKMERMMGMEMDIDTPSFLSKKLLSKKSINEIIKDNYY